MSTQFPDVPALPGVPLLARLTTPAQTFAGGTTTGESQALATQLGLPPTVTFGTDALYAGLGLQSLSGPPASQTLSDSGAGNSVVLPAGALPLYSITKAGGSITTGPITTVAPDGTTLTDSTTTTDSFSATPAISPDSVVELDFGADSQINSHPVEPGTSGSSVGFQAYNRVQDAISIRLLIACQGKNMTRSSFLSTLESLRQGTQIVTIATPDASYPNMVLKGYGYKKASDRGAVTIWADTTWSEERSENVTVSSPPTSQAQGNAVANGGSVQATTPTASQQAVISNPPVPAAPLPPAYQNTAPPSGDAS